ncbi:MAG TPA: hypothetical protein VLA43_11870 [Longimicrobiales bacterium]|nr:hypothetical protein [Longimicrobiales bacterium]
MAVPSHRSITLEKAAGFTAESAGDGGVQGSPAGLSLGPLLVSLGPPPQG